MLRVSYEWHLKKLARKLVRKKEIEYKKEMGSFVVRKCKTLDELITEYVALYGNLYIHEAKISDELYEES